MVSTPLPQPLPGRERNEQAREKYSLQKQTQQQAWSSGKPSCTPSLYLAPPQAERSLLLLLIPRRSRAPRVAAARLGAFCQVVWEPAKPPGGWGTRCSCRALCHLAGGAGSWPSPQHPLLSKAPSCSQLRAPRCLLGAPRSASWKKIRLKKKQSASISMSQSRGFFFRRTDKCFSGRQPGKARIGFVPHLGAADAQKLRPQRSLRQWGWISSWPSTHARTLLQAFCSFCGFLLGSFSFILFFFLQLPQAHNDCLFWALIRRCFRAD